MLVGRGNDPVGIMPPMKLHKYVLEIHRLKEKDFHYQDEWEKLQESGDLLLHSVFSRQDPTGARIYVQRRIRDRAVHVAWLIVERGAHVLVSGSAKQMPQEVREALRNALAGHLQVSARKTFRSICSI